VPSADEARTLGKIRIVIADDYPPFRHALQRVIDAEPDMAVVAALGDGAAALEEIRRLGPDVAVLDVRMPGLDGIEIALRLVEEQLRARAVIVTCIGTACCSNARSRRASAGTWRKRPRCRKSSMRSGQWPAGRPTWLRRCRPACQAAERAASSLGRARRCRARPPPSYLARARSECSTCRAAGGSARRCS
jgi:CheY-like chemotaxis protein